jgi:hypothetical protein
VSIRVLPDRAAAVLHGPALIRVEIAEEALDVAGPGLYGGAQ